MADQDKAAQKIFRLKPEEEIDLTMLITYAHKTGYIKKPELQEFMIFSINCARQVLRQVELARKGLG